MCKTKAKNKGFLAVIDPVSLPMPDIRVSIAFREKVPAVSGEKEFEMITQKMSNLLCNGTSLERLISAVSPYRWSPDSMQRCKDKEAAKLPPNIWYHVERELVHEGTLMGDGIMALFRISGPCALITSLLWSMLAIVALRFPGPQSPLLPSALTFANLEILFAISFTIFIVHVMIASQTVLGPGQWQEFAWSPKVSFNPDIGKVPEDAVCMARSLLLFDSTIVFTVSALKQNKRGFDPFLIASRTVGERTESWPVCAWDPDGSMIEPPK